MEISKTSVPSSQRYRHQSDSQFKSVVYIRTDLEKKTLGLQLKPLIDLSLIGSDMSISDVPVILSMLKYDVTTELSKSTGCICRTIEEFDIVCLNSNKSEGEFFNSDINSCTDCSRSSFAIFPSDAVIIWISIEELMCIQSNGLSNRPNILEGIESLKSWPLLYGIDSDIYTLIKVLEELEQNCDCYDVRKTNSANF